jgi:hypothetical protein
VHASQATQTALDAAKIPVPAELQNGALMEKYQNAMKEADAAYKQADELLQSVTDGAAELDADKAAQAGARAQRIYTLYRWSILSADMGDNEAARAHMESARNEIANAIGNNTRLPALPAELQAIADAAAKPTDGQPTTEETTPGTQPTGDQPPVEQPATEPATPPAGGPG